MGRGGMPKKTKLGKTRLGECDSQDFRSPGDVFALDREAISCGWCACEEPDMSREARRGMMRKEAERRVNIICIVEEVVACPTLSLSPSFPRSTHLCL